MHPAKHEFTEKAEETWNQGYMPVGVVIIVKKGQGNGDNAYKRPAVYADNRVVYLDSHTWDQADAIKDRLYWRHLMPGEVFTATGVD